MELLDLDDALGGGSAGKIPVAAYVPKTITQSPRLGNPPPRILETVGGLINAVGLPGRGLEAFVATELPRLLELGHPLIVSVGGFSVAEYLDVASGIREALYSLAGGEWMSRVGLELNISCPNVHSGCMSIGTDPGETRRAVSAVREVWPGLLVAKLTPNVTDIVAVGRAAEEAGADAVSAVNTYKAMVLDRDTLRPYLGNATGGLSGPAIKPLALKSVFELFEGLEIPIIGMGGIATVQDVMEFIACGASVVAVGSAAFRDQSLGLRLAEGLGERLSEKGLALEQLRGIAHRSG